MKHIFLCDFDGTITNNDLTYQALKLFASHGWQEYDSEYLNGKITLEECLSKQAAMIPVSKTTILEGIKPFSSIREGFKELVQYCKGKGYDFWIVSAGLDFIIQDVLRSNNLHQIPLYCAKTEFYNGKISLSFPKKVKVDSTNFKDDFALQNSNPHQNIISLGDGESDYSLAEKSDITFAIKNSKLSRYCRHKSIRYFEFESFLTIIKILENEIIL